MPLILGTILFNYLLILIWFYFKRFLSINKPFRILDLFLFVFPPSFKSNHLPARPQMAALLDVFHRFSTAFPLLAHMRGGFYLFLFNSFFHLAKAIRLFPPSTNLQTGFACLDFDSIIFVFNSLMWAQKQKKKGKIKQRYMIFSFLAFPFEWQLFISFPFAFRFHFDGQ